MLKEEYRFHTSFSNKYGFFMFPIMIFLLTLILALVSPQLFEQINYEQVILSLHASLFMYGISMGSFAFLGREYVERSTGRINFLISSPVLLPVKFRNTFVAFYIHDVVFYYLMVIVPFTAGLFASIPFMGYSPFSIMFLSVTLFISFIIGLAFSFFMSSIFIRSMPAFLVIIAGIAAGMVGLLVTGGDLGYMVPALNIYLHGSIPFLGLSLVYIIVFSILAAYLIEDKFEVIKPEYRTYFPRVMKKFMVFRKNPHLLAKEYLDLIRSRALTKIAFSFVVPLLFITFISWILRTNLVSEIEFNSVFYASMVGFFSVMIYYWLATNDNLESFQTLPLDVPTVIRSKLIIFIFISSIISTIYIIIISGIYNEFHLVWISLFIMFTTSLYIATSTAYLTGLRTQSYLFNIGVLARFSILSALPMICLQIIVLNLNTYWFVAMTAIGITTLMMALATLVLYRGIDRKWAGADFA
jgi:MFS family permease